MPRRRPGAPAVDATEQRLLAALERVKAGAPTDPELKKRAALNRLRVDVSAVALEAGLSRTLIGHERCRYPRARAAVLGAMRPVVQPRTAAEVINRKRDEVAALREALRLRDSVNAALVLRLHKGVVEENREIRRAGRLAEQSGLDPNRVAGVRFVNSKKRRPDNVVKLRPDDGGGGGDAGA